MGTGATTTAGTVAFPPSRRCRCPCLHSLLLEPCSCKLRYGTQCGLRGVQPQSEVVVVVRGVNVRRLVPLWVPARADLRAALVLAQRDRGHDVLKGRGVGVRHVLSDGGGIIGRVFLVRELEE